VTEQLDLLAPTWTCTTCRGAGEALRLLYPDERESGGPFVAMRRCPTCEGAGKLTYDPDDLSVVPF
jgi:DnaJ-class molecular chaperone